MKIVINKDYGGFYVPNKVLSEMAQIRPCSHIIIMEPSAFYGTELDWEKRYQEDIAQFNEGIESYMAFHENKVILDSHDSTQSRTCERLLEALEKAYPNIGDLNIVEIPDDIEYIIDNYDGMETVESPRIVYG